MNEMKYCIECGCKLEDKYLESEGKNIPFCSSCEEYRFPIFNSAVSMIITNKEKDKILLIKQYGKDRYVLCAGYINQGESAEEAAIREIKEELDLNVIALKFNKSEYFERSNTLMINFAATVEGDINPNWEIDSYGIFSIEEAQKNIARPSLAQKFLDNYIKENYE